MRTLLATLSLCLVVGCASQGPRPASRASRSVVAVDEHQGTTSILGPEVDVRLEDGAPADTARLRAIGSAGKVGLLQVYFSAWRYDWPFFTSAWSRGEALPFAPVDRKVESGHVREDVAATVTMAMLREGSRSGLDVEFAGQRGKTVVRLAPAYVAEFVGAVESWEKKSAE